MFESRTSIIEPALKNRKLALPEESTENLPDCPGYMQLSPGRMTRFTLQVVPCADVEAVVAEPDSDVGPVPAELMADTR